jgi:hypothetical protein
MDNIINDKKKQFIIRTIKIVDIAYIFSFYALAGFFCSLFINKIFPTYTKEKYSKYSKAKLIVEICLQFASIGVMVYLIKNLFELVPFPFDNIYGYKHKSVKELQSALPLIYTILYFQDNLKDKLFTLASKFIKSYEKYIT